MSSTTKIDIAGQCACGAIRYEVRGSRNVGICYCETCRRQSGGAGIGWLLADKATLSASGAATTWRSSSHAERQHCPACGSILFLFEDGRAEVEIAAGSILNQEELRKENSIWVHRRPGWSHD